MRIQSIILAIFVSVIALSCSKTADYTQEFKEQTSGRYLFTQDEVMEVYYEGNKLYLKWRGAEKIKPVIIDERTFFIPDMYKKLRFVEHPETKQRYLSIIDPENEDNITYDYLKLADNYVLPSEHLADEKFDKALEGYLAILEQDSTSTLVDERNINSLGYRYLRNEDFENAIEVFKMNVALFPESDNVYDSLADAYSRNGDSLLAYENYSKSLELNKENVRAIRYIEAYNATQE